MVVRQLVDLYLFVRHEGQVGTGDKDSKQSYKRRVWLVDVLVNISDMPGSDWAASGSLSNRTHCDWWIIVNVCVSFLINLLYE